MLTNNQKGFNLIELMVVLAILSVLTAVATHNYQAMIERSRASGAKTQLAAALKGLQTMQIETGYQFPMVGERFLDDCSVNLNCSDGTVVGWSGPYFDGTVPDPWGTNYFYDNDYSTPGGVVKAFVSFGPNKVEDYPVNPDSDDVWLRIEKALAHWLEGIVAIC